MLSRPLRFIDSSNLVLAPRYSVPAIYPHPAFVQLGGLMSSGGDLADSYRQEGTYTGRILKGAKPADLRPRQAVNGGGDSNAQAPLQC